MKLKHKCLLMLVSVSFFTACSNTDFDEIDKSEYVFSEIKFMEPDFENGGSYLPFSWSGGEWVYDENGILITCSSRFGINQYNFSEMELTDSYMKAKARFELPGSDGSLQVEESEQYVFIENNKIIEINYLFTLIQTKPAFFTTSRYDHFFHYDVDGYLVKITGTEKDGLVTSDVNVQIERKDGNISKIVTEEVVYTYSYDNKEYIQMSDLAPYTLACLYSPYPYPEFYNKMGKQNKNNITKVDIVHKGSPYRAIKTLTYTPEFNQNGKIKSISHTGTYSPHFSEGTGDVSFKNMKTIFIYTPKGSVIKQNI